MSAGAGTQSVRAGSKAPLWAWAVATVCGAGYLRPGPGTWTSILAAGGWLLLAQFVSGLELWITTALTVVMTVFAGIPAATRLARADGIHDPAYVVVDELAGQLLTFVAAPASWKTALAGLILFRVFDIVKPPPLQRLEKLPEGFGVLLDDVAAGLYAFGGLHVLLSLNLLS